MALIGEIAQVAPVVVPTNATVREAATGMRDRGHGAAVVVDHTERPVGILTDRDIALRAVAANLDPNVTPVLAVATPDPQTVSALGDTDELTPLMREKVIRRVVVVDQEGRVAGLISLEDLAATAYIDPGDVVEVLSATNGIPTDTSVERAPA